MQLPSADRVRKLVKKAAKKQGKSQADVARLLGVSVSSLKKNMAAGAAHRAISSPTYQLLMLLADEHPYWQMNDRANK